MSFESYRATSKFINSVWYTEREFVSMRIYTIDFSLLEIKSLDMRVYLMNILDAFFMAYIWYNLSVLSLFTVVKCRGHTNFEKGNIRKIFSINLQLDNLS